MLQVFKVWLGHRTLQGYLAIFILLTVAVVTTGAYSYWYLTAVMLIAPFYEWVVHKYVLHAFNPDETEKRKKFMDRLHRDHHKDPYEVDLLFAPFLVGLSIPVKFAIVAGLLAWDYKAGLFLGTVTLAYYMYYEWIHLAHHIDSYRPITKRGQELKKAHKWHHFKNEHYWWGITSVFGDKVLGTFPKPNAVSHSTTVKDIVAVPALEES